MNDQQLPTLHSQLLTLNSSAIILAGGKSSRMGQPKALLPFDGEPLIVHTVRTLKRLFADIIVVAAPGSEFIELLSLLSSQPYKPYKPNEPNVTLVRDEVAYQGPVGGIYYGLRAANKEVCFVTSCDVPFLNLSLIQYLIEQIPGYDVVVPRWQDRFQPLHAVYRKSVVLFLQEQLARGELRPIFLYSKVRTREVNEEEVRRFDPEGLNFLNMNTPEDYQAALARWQDKSSGLRVQGAKGQESRAKSPELNKVSGPKPLALSSKPSQDGPTTCTVELFGVARLLAKTAEVSLVLPQGATLSHVFSTLAERLPILVGPVITADRSGLTGGYACNINGQDFVRSPDVKVNPGDSILIISSDAGG